MRIIIRLFFLLLSGISIYAQDSLSIKGIWQDTENSRRSMKIEQMQDGSFQGIITESPDKPEFLGFKVLRAMHWNTQERYWSGIIVAPENPDDELKAIIRVENKSTCAITVKKFIFSKTLYFKKVK